MYCLPLKESKQQEGMQFYYSAKIKHFFWGGGLRHIFLEHFLEFHLKTLHNLEPDALALASHFSKLVISLEGKCSTTFSTLPRNPLNLPKEP